MHPPRVCEAPQAQYATTTEANESMVSIDSLTTGLEWPCLLKVALEARGLDGATHLLLLSCLRVGAGCRVSLACVLE